MFLPRKIYINYYPFIKKKTEFFSKMLPRHFAGIFQERDLYQIRSLIMNLIKQLTDFKNLGFLY